MDEPNNNPQMNRGKRIADVQTACMSVSGVGACLCVGPGGVRTEWTKYFANHRKDIP
jgi:hypothetical protein